MSYQKKKTSFVKKKRVNPRKEKDWSENNYRKKRIIKNRIKSATPKYEKNVFFPKNKKRRKKRKLKTKLQLQLEEYGQYDRSSVEKEEQVEKILLKKKYTTLTNKDGSPSTKKTKKMKKKFDFDNDNQDDNLTKE
jgi:hypothetical protein